MELRVLKYFIAVVQKNNITHAAEALHISQPTISRQLHDLEKELGVTLFNRNGRSLELTPAGNYFAEQAKQILALADKTLSNVQKTAEISGNVMIGCAEIPMMKTVATSIRQMKNSAPKVIANIYSADADDVYRGIQTGIYDFGVVMEPADKINYNFLKLPGFTSWGVLLTRNSPLAHKTGITVEDLRNAQLIAPRQQSNADVFADWLGNSDVALDVIATYNLLFNASVMAANGVGIVLCLDGIINTVNTNLTFVPLTPHLDVKSSLIWSKSVSLSPSAKVFLETVKSTISKKVN